MFTKERLKGFAAGCAAALVLTGATGAFSSPLERMISVAMGGIKVIVDGDEVKPKDANGNAVEPLIYNGTTYLPVRAIGEAIGKEVNWDGANSTVYVGDVPVVVAKVNGEELKLSEFMYYLNRSKNQVMQQANSPDGKFSWATSAYNGKNAAEAAKDMALESLIRDAVAAQKAASSGIVIDDNARAQIENQKNNIIQQFGGKAAYLGMLEDIGAHDNDVNRSLERSYLIYMLYSQKKQTDPGYQLSDDALKDYYSKNMIRARHILIKTVDQNGLPLSDDDKKKAKEKAEKILEEIKGGADFVKLMNENSDDPGSKSQPDGYIFGKGDMIKEFEDAAYALKEGEVSGIVESRYGYHIIKRENAMEKYDSYIANQGNKEDLKSRILNEKFLSQMEAWVKETNMTIDRKHIDAVEIK